MILYQNFYFRFGHMLAGVNQFPLTQISGISFSHSQPSQDNLFFSLRECAMSSLVPIFPPYEHSNGACLRRFLYVCKYKKSTSVIILSENVE
jgi:hypothetical protein